MDNQRFDNLSRGIARATSRRQVLKTLAGAAVGALFGVRSRADVGAATPNPLPVGRGNTSESTNTTASAVSPASAAPAPAPMPTGRGKTNCSGVQSDLSSDAQNCGSCGHACTAGQVCVNGACGASCPAGQTSCNGSCRALSADNNNCGACGHVCPPNTACSNGACVVSCGRSGTNCNGVCVDLTTDRTHLRRVRDRVRGRAGLRQWRVHGDLPVGADAVQWSLSASERGQEQLRCVRGDV